MHGIYENGTAYTRQLYLLGYIFCGGNMYFIKNFIKRLRIKKLCKIAFSENHKDKSKALDNISQILKIEQ